MKNNKFKLISGLQALMALVFAGSLVFVLLYFIDNNQSQENLNTLSQEINNARQKLVQTAQPTAVKPKQTDFPNPVSPDHQDLLTIIPQTAPDESPAGADFHSVKAGKKLDGLNTPYILTASANGAPMGALPAVYKQQYLQNAPGGPSSVILTARPAKQTMKVFKAQNETQPNISLSAQPTPQISLPLPAQTAQPNPLLDAYRGMQARNPDFVGWIHIYDTIVDYPVMYTPLDMEKYLHLDFDGNYSRAGLPFMDTGAMPNDRGLNQVIYAHNMQSGQMFAFLHKYFQDEYWDKYRTLSFDTVDMQREYEVIALIPLILTNLNRPSMMIFHPLTTQTQEAVDEINEYLTLHARRQAGEVQVGDDLLTLVTCRKLSNSDRLLVVARNTGE